MTNPKPASSFREDLTELEKLTQLLEDDNIDLESALSSFERGNELVKRLKGQLESAQLRIKEIQANVSSKDVKKD